MARPRRANAVTAAALILTNKNTLKIIGCIILGAVIVIVAPFVILWNVMDKSASLDWNSPEMQQQVIDNMTDEQRAKLAYFETVMASIEDEISVQGLAVDPVKAQVIYIYALNGREKDNENFYAEYISCFVGAADDEAVFTNITEKFGVAFTGDEQQEIADAVQQGEGTITRYKLNIY